MTTFARDRYHHGNLRAELMRVAGQILDQSGVAALTLREAARRAGVSHAAPYRHFADREALLAEMVAQGFAQLAAALRAAVPEGGSAVARSYLSFALERPRRYRLMYSGDALALRRAASAGHADVLLPLIAQSIPELVDADHARRAATAAWSLLHGLALLLIDGHLGPPPPAAEADRVVREVLGTLRFAARPAASA